MALSIAGAKREIQMITSKWIAHLGLVMISMTLTQWSRSSDGATLSSSQRGAAPTHLEVDAEHWPVALLPLARTAIGLVAKRGESAYLTQIDIQLPDVNESRPLTSVAYTFYNPKTGGRLSVLYANSDVSLSPEEMKMARQAGVADVMKRAQEAAMEPQLTEMPVVKQRDAPQPLPGAQMGLREAYALARSNGLIRADHISLSVSTKDPKAPLVLWTFQGEHARRDSQSIHIDALTGQFVDEDRINDLSRAERNARLQKAFEALQALARPNSTGGLGPEQTQTNCPNGYQGGLGSCHRLGNWQDSVQPLPQ